MMKNSSNSLWKLTASGLMIATLLQGCGGGGGGAVDALLGGNSAQIASGVVTGFGSVFVDGVEIEDAHASVVTENADGSTTNSVLQMGQRIRVAHNGKGTASKVTVDAAVIGAVSTIDTTAQTLTVAAQKVSINSDVNSGPVTVWAGGYSSLADVQANDLIEVHGNPVYDATALAYKVVATRIQKMTAVSSLKVNGKISNLDATAKTFALNGLTVSYASAALYPSTGTLANDLVVSVYGPTSALSGTTLTASNVKINHLQDSTTLTTTLAQVGGQVSLYDSTAKTFEVQGVKVLTDASTSITPSGATVANNAYVKVTGSVGSDGKLTASAIEVREQSTTSDLAKVRLIGVISDYVDATSFVVRGVPVDARGINASTSCPNVTLGNDIPVTITATQQTGTPVVLATSMSCQAASKILIKPKDGVVSTVNATSKTFVLTDANNQTSTVQWTDTTTFMGLTSATLDASTVRVEGYSSNGTFIARVIGIANSDTSLDDDKFRRKSHNDNAETEWTRYRNSHPHH